MSEFKFTCPVCGQHMMCDSSQQKTVIECRNETLATQSPIVLPAPGKPESFKADRCNLRNLSDSCYIWLPFTISSGVSTIAWRDNWIN